jgi:acyl carrier protein
MSLQRQSRRHLAHNLRLVNFSKIVPTTNAASRIVPVCRINVNKSSPSSGNENAVQPRQGGVEMENIKEELRQFIISEFLPDGQTPQGNGGSGTGRISGANLNDDTPLQTSGILDSTAMLRVVNFVEERYGIEVRAHEMGVENFDSIDAIAAFVESKGGAATA